MKQDYCPLCTDILPMLVAVRCKAWVCGRWLVGIAVSNPIRDRDVCLLWVLCVVQVEVYATIWSLAKSSPTECDHEASTISRPWPNISYRTTTKKTPIFQNTCYFWVRIYWKIFKIQFKKILQNIIPTLDRQLKINVTLSKRSM